MPGLFAGMNFASAPKAESEEKPEKKEEEKETP
jgi:hypothetical protein